MSAIVPENEGTSAMTPEVLKRLIPEMVAAYESPEVREQIEAAAHADDRMQVMQIAMRAQAQVLMRHGFDPATGLRAIAEAARTHRDDPEIVELSNRLRWRLTALYNDGRARPAPVRPQEVEIEGGSPPSGPKSERTPPPREHD